MHIEQNHHVGVFVIFITQGPCDQELPLNVWILARVCADTICLMGTSCWAGGRGYKRWIPLRTEEEGI